MEFINPEDFTDGSIETLTKEISSTFSCPNRYVGFLEIEFSVLDAHYRKTNFHMTTNQVQLIKDNAHLIVKYIEQIYAKTVLTTTKRDVCICDYRLITFDKLSNEISDDDEYDHVQKKGLTILKNTLDKTYHTHDSLTARNIKPTMIMVGVFKPDYKIVGISMTLLYYPSAFGIDIEEFGFFRDLFMAIALGYNLTTQQAKETTNKCARSSSDSMKLDKMSLETYVSMINEIRMYIIKNDVTFIKEGITSHDQYYSYLKKVISYIRSKYFS